MGENTSMLARTFEINEIFLLIKEVLKIKQLNPQINHGFNGL